MKAALRLTPVHTSEAEEFLEMAKQHFRELNPAFKPAKDWTNTYFSNIRGNRGYRLRWIEAQGQRAGFILYGMENHRFLPRKTGAIYELYVVPAQRRKGLARECALRVITELRKLCPSKIQLEVMMGNTAASALWKSLGFQEVSERLVLSCEIPA